MEAAILAQVEQMIAGNLDSSMQFLKVNIDRDRNSQGDETRHQGSGPHSCTKLCIFSSWRLSMKDVHASL
jgi:hypothetical protein